MKYLVTRMSSGGGSEIATEAKRSGAKRLGVECPEAKRPGGKRRLTEEMVWGEMTRI